MKMPGAAPENQNKDPLPGAGGNDPENTPNPNDPAGQESKGTTPDDEDSIYSDPEKARKLAKDLRAEAAKHRTDKKAQESKLAALSEQLKTVKAALGLEDEEKDPAELAQSLQSKNEALEIELAMVRLEKQHGITPDQEKYFRFLISQKFDEIEEGEELSDEQIAEVAQTVKTTLGGKPAVNATGLHTSKKPDAKPADGEVSVEEFAKMNTGERSLLYTKNQGLYARLMSEAREKRLIK